MILEVCAASFESAKNAEQSGADRIELCSELVLGGITPSYGLLKKVADELSIPAHILIRPRSGNFTYDNEEFEVMKRDILLCKELGFDGIVSGLLNKDLTLDIDRTRVLIELAAPLSFTFHRAFDWVPDPLKTIEQLIGINADRILSSGQEDKAIKGLGLLKRMLKQSADRISILPGGGINADNISIFRDSGFKEAHFSASSIKKTSAYSNLPMNDCINFSEDELRYSDMEKIRAICDLVK